MRRSAAMFLLLASVVSVSAYDSKCKVGGAPCSNGPGQAQGRWEDLVGDLDEHRLIWERTRELAGLPVAASSAFTLHVFPGPTDVQANGETVPSVQPVDFRDAARAFDRPGPRTPGEFAQLPDFSYSLWDWVLGNETCPLDASIPAVACHTFETHMGPANSSHFPPQSQEFYRHYHGLAVERAKACDALSRRLGATRATFLDYVTACEQEALVLEAIGQHFLQDAWAMGHMWERWGSPDASEILPKLNQARVVGGIAGLIHGARGSLQGVLPSSDVDDPMGAPAAGVAWRFPDAASTPFPAVGDEYYRLVEPQYAEQFKQLYSCTVSGLREVYDQLSNPALGAAGSSDARLSRIDPVDGCFSQRATNLAMEIGAALDVRSFLTPEGVDLTATLVDIGFFVIPKLVELDDAPKITAQERLDIVQTAIVINYWSKEKPAGIQAASGGIPELFGFGRNRRYANRKPIASYIDPPLPWTNANADPHAIDLARGFHRAHADEWCAAMNGPYLEALRQKVLDASDSADPDALPTAIDVCAEFAQRHARAWSVNNGVTAALVAQPFCASGAAAPAQVAYIDQLASGSIEAGRNWCTCGDGRREDIEECDPSDVTVGDAACPGRCLPRGHTRTVGTTTFLDECTCLACDDPATCSKIAFIRRIGCEIGCDGVAGELRMMNPDGSQDEKLLDLPDTDRISTPTWSPDHKRLAYSTSPAHDFTAVDVHIYNVVTRHADGVVATITASSLYPTTSDARPTWSPDGTKIALEGVNGIHTIDLANGNYATWLAAPAHYWDPAWSPDGSKLAVQGAGLVDGTLGVGIMPAAGGTARLAGPTSFVIVGPRGGLNPYRELGRHPQWSPDGTKLVFVSGDAGTAMAVISSQGGGVATLLRPDPRSLDPLIYAPYRDPAWSADGTRIVFVDRTYDNSAPLGQQEIRNIWTMKPDGSDVRPLTSASIGAFWNTSPAW